MEPGVILVIALWGIYSLNGLVSLIFNDRSGALDDEKAPPAPYGRRSPKVLDSGLRRDHD